MEYSKFRIVKRHFTRWNIPIYEIEGQSIGSGLWWYKSCDFTRRGAMKTLRKVQKKERKKAERLKSRPEEVVVHEE